MRYTNINNTISFSRAMLIHNSGRGCLRRNFEKMNSVYEMQNVLNSEKSNIYTEKTAQKIKDFFKNILGDYNGENGIVIRAFGNKVILFSGEETNKLKQLESVAHQAKDEVERACHMKRKRKEQVITNIQNKVNAGVLEMLENGKNKKNYSVLELKFEDKFIKDAAGKSQHKIQKITYANKFHFESEFSPLEFEPEIPFRNAFEYDTLKI